MQLTALYADEEAVTPVIGIVLVVAITVILASIIGVFAMGLGSRTTPEGPSVVVAFDYDGSAASGTDSWGRSSGGAYDGLLTITHRSGSEVPPERLTLTGATGLSDGRFTDEDALDSQKFYDAGDELSVWVAADDTVRIVWRNPEGSKSTTVAVWTGA